MQTFKLQCSMRDVVEGAIKALGMEKSGQQFCLRSRNRDGQGKLQKEVVWGFSGGLSQLSI